MENILWQPCTERLNLTLWLYVVGSSTAHTEEGKNWINSVEAYCVRPLIFNWRILIFQSPSVCWELRGSCLLYLRNVCMTSINLACMNNVGEEIRLEQVWYFISKNHPGLWHTDPLKSSPGSHSLVVSDSGGTTSSCSLLAFPLSISLT